MIKKLKKIISFTFGRKPSHYWRYFIDRKKMKQILKEKKEFKQLQNPSKIAIIFIGTDSYIKFFPRYYETIKRKFLPNTIKEFFVFTNQIKNEFLLDKKDVTIIPIEHKKIHFFLRTFEFINQAEKKLKKYPMVIFIDADMYINEVISEEEFFCHDKSLFGVQHPNFVSKRALEQFEHNTKSLASINKNEDTSIYWQCCLVGGKSKDFLKLTKKLAKRICKDLKNKVIAKWYDESHLNKYFIENKSLVHTYNPSYSYPKDRPIPKPFKKKIIHIWEGKEKILYKPYKKRR